ncbi:MAG TPA: DUF4229 domain-containing protein [Mycobacteriales bacterium]|nr:DUF4229 domain-containing protein [Mycobacteriales bacterium]
MTDPASVPEARPQLSRLALRYTGLRFGVFAVCFGVGCAVMLPLDGSSAPTFFKAALIAAVLSLPISFVLGRDLRAQIAAGIEDQRSASRARADDDAARVAAARARRQRSTDAATDQPVQ